ncbi:MAG: hypothetical protein WC390_09085 [Sulfurimonas sp.]
MLGGESISVEYPEEIAEELFEEMRSAIECGESWFVANYNDVKATYHGNVINYINTRLIVGYV